MTATDPLLAAIDARIHAAVTAVRADSLGWIAWSELPGMTSSRRARRWAERHAVRISHVGRVLVLDRADVERAIGSHATRPRSATDTSAPTPLRQRLGLANAPPPKRRAGARDPQLAAGVGGGR